MKVHIPSSIEEATAQLGGIGALLTAKEWERAAIVYAFTEEGAGSGARTDLGREPYQGRLSIRTFAALSISGLRSRDAVTQYRRAWEEAGGDTTIGPGDDVDLPEVPWKSVYGESTPDVQERVARQVMADPVRVGRIIQDNPSIREAVTRAVVRAAPDEVQDRLYEERVPASARAASIDHRPIIDYDADVEQAVRLLDRAIRAELSGDWRPSPRMRQLLAFLPLLLEKRENPLGPAESIHDDIAAYLAAERTL